MKYIIFGGTGSLGKALLERLSKQNQYDRVLVYSRDEEKHRKAKLLFPFVENYIGDIRDYDKINQVLQYLKPDIVINAAALKQIDIKEDFPEEAVKTNILGTMNLNKALQSYQHNQLRVVSVSTDKAPSPVNSYRSHKTSPRTPPFERPRLYQTHT
jgi:UDP-N-acetylglucosamine 4,6-dehydratase